MQMRNLNEESNLEQSGSKLVNQLGRKIKCKADRQMRKVSEESNLGKLESKLVDKMARQMKVKRNIKIS